ncbi:DUF4256 domain-containing protein [Metabacillus indicus]|uniref:DUF4256 domain-containing protein n=1 Tax=Metabacillus indicus TaxID=246786 RepID=UPI003CF910BB
MTETVKKELSQEEESTLIDVLTERFEQNMNRHPGLEWAAVQAKLSASPEKMWSLHEMERTGGEPDVIAFEDGEYHFCDCSAESPSGRRSLCYDRKALDARKKNKPENSIMDLAASMGIEVLNGEQYRSLQEFGPFDRKTSSWIQTPAAIRDLGGALFCDYRYGHVFVYHNGADSYYAARGFRGLLKV